MLWKEQHMPPLPLARNRDIVTLDRFSLVRDFRSLVRGQIGVGYGVTVVSSTPSWEFQPLSTYSSVAVREERRGGRRI